MSHPSPETAVAVPVDLNDPLADLDQAFRLAKMLSQSSMVPQALRGSPQNCLITMLLGRELGLSWIQAIRGIYVLPSGQPGLRGSLLLARIRAAGHRYEFIETDNECLFVLTRKDEDFKTKHTGKFSLEDAKAAGLVKEHDGKLVARSRNGDPLPWELYRRDMLQWRAVARGAARGCPELIFGFDLAGIGDGDDGANTVTAEVIPQPHREPTESEASELREKLAELNRQHETGPDGQATHEHMERWQKGEETHKGEEGEADYEAEPGKEKRTPGLPELHELLRRCGYTGTGQKKLCAALIHRQISDMSQLTPGEIFMVHDTVTRVSWGVPAMKERHDALENYLKTAEGIEEEEHESQ